MMTEKEILALADHLVESEDDSDFPIWAYNHIRDSHSVYKHNITPEEEECDDDVFRYVAIHLDFYWLMECSDDDEAIRLLHFWYERRGWHDKRKNVRMK